MANWNVLFLGCFFVVSPILGADGKTESYRLNIANKSGINPYYPYFPENMSVFKKDDRFKDFLLLKCMYIISLLIRIISFSFNHELLAYFKWIFFYYKYSWTIQFIFQQTSLPYSQWSTPNVWRCTAANLSSMRSALGRCSSMKYSKSTRKENGKKSYGTISRNQGEHKNKSRNIF